MIKIFIVEDELPAIERIRNFNLWNSGEYSITGIAGNGKEALAEIEKNVPDVVLTDIEMPVMNGIEMIKLLRDSNPELPVIILSCHESFEYAKEAVSLGVREYILKDFMEEDAVRLALSKMSPSPVAGNGYRDQSPGIMNADEAAALLTAVTRPGTKRNNALSRFSESENNLLYIHLDGFSISRHDPRKYFDEISCDIGKFEAEGGRAAAVYADGGNYWLLVGGDGRRLAETFFDRMKNRSDTITIAAGETFSGVENLYEEAARVKELFSFRVFLGKNRVILPECAAAISGRKPSSINDKIDSMKKAVYETDSTACFNILRELYERDLPGMLKYNYLEYVNLRLLSLILSLSEMGRISLREMAGTDSLSMHALEEKETVTEIREWFENIFGRIFNVEGSEAGVSNRVILKAIKIIKTRYDEDLSLEEIAEEIGVHKVYLSRLFKKEAGRNYYDYLQNYRNNKALMLLADDNLKINEVALKSGFKNYDQFAVVFRKLNGCTPSAYRKKLTEK